MRITGIRDKLKRLAASCSVAMLALGVLLTLVWIGTLIWIVFYLLVTTSQLPSGSSKAEACVEDEVRTQKSQRSTICTVAHWPMAMTALAAQPRIHLSFP
jgi:hypothetical protein